MLKIKIDDLSPLLIRDIIKEPTFYAMCMMGDNLNIDMRMGPINETIFKDVTIDTGSLVSTSMLYSFNIGFNKGEE